MSEPAPLQLERNVRAEPQRHANTHWVWEVASSRKASRGLIGKSSPAR